MADFTLLFEDWSLTSVIWVGSATADLLNMLRFYHYATSPGGAPRTRSTTPTPIVSRRCWRRRG